MLQELLRGLTTHPCYPPNLPIPLQLALNWVVGLASSGIIYGGCQLTGSFVYFWLMLMCTLSNGVGECTLENRVDEWLRTLLAHANVQTLK